MKKITYAILLVFAGIFTSCGVSIKKVESIQDPKLVVQSKPKHSGSFTPLVQGIYNIEVYRRSVAFNSTNKLVHPSEVHIFDLDSDSKFDTVFVLEQGTWSYGITPEFRAKYRVNNPTLHDKATGYWISRAVSCKKILAPKPVVKETQKGITPNTTPSTEVKNPQPTRWWAPFPSS